MKKCASCSKDLPEAALHCVFCGAKQLPTAAVGPGVAKTAFGYSANEVMDQLRGPGSPPGGGAYPPPSAPPYGQPQRAQPPSQPPPYGYGQQQPPFGGAPQYGGVAPNQAAQAPTMFAGPQGGPQYPQQPQYPQAAPAWQQTQPMGGPQPGYPPPPQTYQPPSPGMGIHSPHQHTPLPLAPAMNSPYLGAHGMRAGAPIEPWKDSLRLMMFIWGAVLIAAFVTPTGTDPMAFHWNVIADAPGTAKIAPLLLGAVGLLGIVLAAVPMMPLPRGLFAALLGLAGVFVPIFVHGMPEWRLLITMIGMIALVPGLLVRQEYTPSLLSRILVTVGVLCTLLPLVIPEHGEIPLVGIVKFLIDAPGREKVAVLIGLSGIIVVLMSLLAWMPAPATAAAKVFAWLIIAWPAVDALVALSLGGHAADAIKAAPYDALMKWAPEVAYSVFIGYGVATVIGKQLE